MQTQHRERSEAKHNTQESLVGPPGFEQGSPEPESGSLDQPSLRPLRLDVVMDFLNLMVYVVISGGLKKCGSWRAEGFVQRASM